MDRSLDELCKNMSKRHRRSSSGEREYSTSSGKRKRPKCDIDAPKSRNVVGIFGMDGSTSSEGLRRFFRGFGELEKVRLIKDPMTGKSKRFAFLTFYFEEDAAHAVEVMNGAQLDGSKIRVDFAFKSSIDPRYIENKRPLLDVDGELDPNPEFGKKTNYPTDLRELLKSDSPQEAPASPTSKYPAMIYINPEHESNRDKVAWPRSLRKFDRAGYPKGFDPRADEGVSIRKVQLPTNEYDSTRKKRKQSTRR